MFSTTRARSNRTGSRAAKPAAAGVSDRRVVAAPNVRRPCVWIALAIAAAASPSARATASSPRNIKDAPNAFAPRATRTDDGATSSDALAGVCCPCLFDSRNDMTPDDLPPLLRDLLYAERHRLLDDPVGDAVKRVISAGVDDDFVRGLLTEPVRRHKIARAFGGPFDSPHLHDGEIVVGLDSNGDPIRVPAQSFNDHCLTLSGSGGGKTIKSRFLALQIAPHVDGLWLIDLRKMEFRGLVSPLRRVGVDLIVLPARWLRWNPLQCPCHVEPLDFAPRVADLLVQVLRLPARASKLVHQVLFELYERSGVLKGSDHFPTLFELREQIATSREANAPRGRRWWTPSIRY